ncbi:MAG: tetratricopeptide repeat protein [Treponematales bacterium]
MNRTKILGILAAGFVALAAFGAASCASTGSAGDGLSLQEAIEQAAAGVSGKLPPKTRVAIVNFDSESPELSEYVMEELTGALYDTAWRTSPTGATWTLCARNRTFRFPGR